MTTPSHTGLYKINEMFGKEPNNLKGFIQGGGLPPSHNFPYSEILKLSVYYISYLHVTERKYVSSKCLEICPRLQSERCINSKFSLGGGGRGGTCLVRMHAFRTLLSSCYHPATILFPPQLKILYETLI